MDVNKKKKEYLSAYIKHKKKILRLEAEIEEIKEIQYSAKSMQQDGLPHSAGNTKDLSNFVVKIEGEKEKIIKERYLQVKYFTEIRKQINLITDEESKTVLIYRYIKGLTWEEIAQKMYCSVRQVYRKHGIALKEFTLPAIIEKQE